MPHNNDATYSSRRELWMQQSSRRELWIGRSDEAGIYGTTRGSGQAVISQIPNQFLRKILKIDLSGAVHPVDIFSLIFRLKFQLIFSIEISIDFTIEISIHFSLTFQLIFQLIFLIENSIDCSTEF